MFVAALAVELHLPDALSLKQKRGLVKPVVEGLRRRYRVAAAEVDHLNAWQRATIGVAIVARTEAHALDIIGEVERFVWSQPDVEVLEIRRSWLEED